MKIHPGILDFYNKPISPYPTSGLKLELKFEDNVTDTSGEGVSISGSPASYTTGKVGKAATFNGTSTNLTATTSILNNTDFTISFWCYSQSPFQPHAFNAKSGSSYMWMGPYASSHWYLYYYIDGGASQTITWYDETGIENEWHHFLVTCDKDGTTYMYIDNTDRGSYTTGLAPTFTSIGIGKRIDFDTYFKGYLDQLRVYNRVLTSAERTTLYNSGNGI